MSWLDPLSRPLRRSLRLGTIVVLSLALSACLRPLYGPTATGERLDDVLASIEVAQMEVETAHERFSHYLRSELVFDLNGSGLATQKRYKLTMQYSQQVQSAIVDTATGRAQSATVVGSVPYRLTTLDGREVVSGLAVGQVSYDRSQQRFATVRAARDAEIRLAKLLSEQIRTRLSAALAARA